MDGFVMAPGPDMVDLDKVRAIADEALKKAEEALDASGVMTISVVPSQSGTLSYTGEEQSPAWNNFNQDTLTIGGTTAGTDAGSYEAVFTPKKGYKWGDDTTDPKTVTWTISRAIIATTPSQSGSLTYNGSAQSPTWSGYDTGKMTLGGTTSGTNAGSYNATFTPTANYKWPDGSAGAKTIAWSIAKAAGSLTLDKSSLNITGGSTTGNITVTRAGDGAITAQSNNTGVATVSVSGNVVTVTGKAYGTAVITVNVAEGTNHTAPASKTCNVSVQIFNTNLASNTWAQIRAASDSGSAANFWDVGDTKNITINGTVGNTRFSNLSIDVYILGFNHNSSREGNNKIHFQIGKISGKSVCLVDSNYNSTTSSSGAFTMNTSWSNSGGWEASHMRKTILGSDSSPSSPRSGTLLAALPADLRAVMKPITKYSDNTGGGSNSSSYVKSTTDYLLLLSEFEVQGSRTYANSAEQNYQQQYQYFKSGNSKVKYRHNSTGSTTAYWWLRSVYSSYDLGFCLVDTGGGANNNNANNSYGVAPCFAA